MPQQVAGVQAVRRASARRPAPAPAAAASTCRRHHPGREARTCGVARTPADHAARPGPTATRHGRRAAAGQQRQRGQHRQRATASAGRAPRPAPYRNRLIADQLRQLGRRLVAQLQQAQRGDQRQQGAVGDGPRVVDRLGLAAEGEGQRLRGVGARQVEGGCTRSAPASAPAAARTAARGQRRVDPAAPSSADEGGAQPVRQQRGVGRHAAERRRQPAACGPRRCRPCGRRP